MAWVREKFQLKETVVSIIAEPRFIPLAISEIVRQRERLENYIELDPGFKHSLQPYQPLSSAPEIAVRMARAAAAFGVGPMAAVAGAVAHFALMAMVKAGASHAIVDNGGDIALILNQPITVGIFSGQESTSQLGLRIGPLDSPHGICSSSGTVGHSFSFGRADVACVVAADAIYADAAATSLGNAITSGEPTLVNRALKSCWREGVKGMMVIIQETIGLIGELPPLVRVRPNPDLITRI